MIRWPLLVIGVALLALSAVATVKFPMLPDEPAVLAVQEAITLAGESDYQYVRVKSLPDLDRKIYPTLSVRPVYTGRPPTEKYDLDPDGAPLPDDLDSYLGTVVRIRRPLESEHVAMQTTSKRTGEKEKLVRERLLAPVSGCNGRVWAISEAFKADDFRRNGWADVPVVEGVLTRLSEVNTNMRYYQLEHNWKEVQAFVGKELQTPMPDDGYLVLTDYEWCPPDYFYCPLQNGNDTIFAQLDPDWVAGLTDSVTGVFEPADLKLYREFADVLGQPLPDRIGIVTMQTAEQYNQRRASNAQGMRYAGAFLAGLGLLGLCLRGLKKRKRARQQAPAPLREAA